MQVTTVGVESNVLGAVRVVTGDASGPGSTGSLTLAAGSTASTDGGEVRAVRVSGGSSSSSSGGVVSVAVGTGADGGELRLRCVGARGRLLQHEGLSCVVGESLLARQLEGHRDEGLLAA